MTWSTYAAFAALAAVVTLAPGPDFALVLRNSLARGRRAGLLTTLGVISGCLVQGTLAALGVGEVIARSQPLFIAMRVLGGGYLAYLGVSALLAARRGDEAAPLPDSEPPPRSGALSWWQGLLCNVTNPKVLAFYVSVLPQFLGRHATTATALALAYTLPLLGFLYLLLLVALMHRARNWFQRRRVRRALDAATGTALLGFATALAVEST